MRDQALPPALAREPLMRPPLTGVAMESTPAALPAKALLLLELVLLVALELRVVRSQHAAALPAVRR